MNTTTTPSVCACVACCSPAIYHRHQGQATETCSHLPNIITMIAPDNDAWTMSCCHPSFFHFHNCQHIRRGEGPHPSLQGFPITVRRGLDFDSEVRAAVCSTIDKLNAEIRTRKSAALNLDDNANRSPTSTGRDFANNKPAQGVEGKHDQSQHRP